MKKVFIIISLVLSFISSQAQFKTAVLQASGLTCAMCSKAINESLEQLSFIESVKADIKNSAFRIVFKPGASMDIDELKKAVEDAGFSVAKLRLSGDFPSVAIRNDEHVDINGSTFHFLKVSDQTLNGEKEITIVDKNFLTSKEFKKFAAATHMQCIQTGKAESCCKKEAGASSARIYHATI